MKEIKFPKRSKTFAEFLGICFGDGCLSVNKRKHDYSLHITGHFVDDKLYMKIYLTPLIKNLFGLDPKLRKQKGNTAILYLRSKSLVSFLNNNGMQIGKKDNLNIPDWIKTNTNFMKAFLRGLVDTDGSLAFKRRHKEIHYYPAISISSSNKRIIEDVHSFLKSNGFELGKVVKSLDSIEGYNKLYPHFRVFLYGEKNLERWIRLIGFSNMKHKSKYLLWKNLGYSPYHLSTPDRIKIIKSPERDLNLRNAS